MGDNFADVKCPDASGCIDQVNYYQMVLELSLLFEEHNYISQGPTGNRWGN